MRRWWWVLGAFSACGTTTTTVTDVDLDGFDASVDCDDGDAAIFPGAAEACDAIDNDCDGTPDDVAPGVGARFYADTDGDGFGDPATGAEGCAAPAGAVEDGTDCADDDAHRFPGAPELCDGVDTDCDPSTPESGAALEDASGWSDLSAAFAAGTAEIPASIALDEAGALHICDGVWYAGLEIGANVAVIGEDGAATLDGGSVGGLVVVRGGPWEVSISDLTLANPGAVDLSEHGLPITGGGLICADQAVVTMTGVDVVSVTAPAYPVAGGLGAAYTGCDLTVTDSAFIGGTGQFGGQLYLVETSARFTRTLFMSGSGNLGGSLLVDGFNQHWYDTGTSPVVTCTDCDFSDNSGLFGGAVHVYTSGQFEMTGGSINDNRALERLGGAVVVDYGFAVDSPASATLHGVRLGGNVGWDRDLGVVGSDVYLTMTTTNQDYPDGVVQDGLFCTVASCE